MSDSKWGLSLPPSRDFRLIWSASIVSQLGDWAARIALALLVLDRTGSAAAVGVAAVIFLVPWLGPGQYLTARSARLPRRTVLFASDALRGVVFVAIGLIEMPIGVVLALVAVSAMVDPVFEATKSAFVSELVTTEEYANAIQVTHAANQASIMIGYALGGVLVAALGASTTLTLNGVTFLGSALLVWLVRERGHNNAPTAPQFSAALRFLRSDRLSMIAFATVVLAVGPAMSVESQVAVYGKVVAGFGDRGVGFLSAMTPLATLLVVSAMRKDDNDRRFLRVGMAIVAAVALVNAALFFAGSTDILAFVAFALLGVIFGIAPLTNIVVGRRLPPADDNSRVGIFSILQSGVFLALSLGSLLGGVVSESTSPETAAGGSMVLVAVCMVVLIGVVGRAPGRAPKHAA